MACGGEKSVSGQGIVIPEESDLSGIWLANAETKYYDFISREYLHTDFDNFLIRIEDGEDGTFWSRCYADRQIKVTKRGNTLLVPDSLPNNDDVVRELTYDGSDHLYLEGEYGDMYIGYTVSKITYRRIGELDMVNMGAFSLNYPEVFSEPDRICIESGVIGSTPERQYVDVEGLFDGHILGFRVTYIEPINSGSYEWAGTSYPQQAIRFVNFDMSPDLQEHVFGNCCFNADYADVVLEKDVNKISMQVIAVDDGQSLSVSGELSINQRWYELIELFK